MDTVAYAGEASLSSGAEIRIQTSYKNLLTDRPQGQ